MPNLIRINRLLRQYLKFEITLSLLNLLRQLDFSSILFACKPKNPV